MLSQRRAFRQSTSIARRGGHKSIWAMRLALVFALRLLRLGRPALGSYWNLPATEYRRKAAGGSIQPELAFPSERQVSGQSTNIAPRGGRRSISAMLLARVFAPRRPRSSSWLRVPNSGRVAGARQRIHRFPIRVGIKSALEPASAQFARKSERQTPALVQFVQPEVPNKIPAYPTQTEYCAYPSACRLPTSG